MTHYDDVKSALLIIENIIKKIKIVEETAIIYQIRVNYGFSEKFVRKHFKLLMDRGVINIDNGMITFVEDKNE